MLLAFALLIDPAFACDGHKSSTATATETVKADTHAGDSKSCGLPKAETAAALPEGGTRASLTVTGMHCGGCANSVHAALMKVEGVTGAQVDFTTGKVEVAYDAAKVKPEGLVAAVAALKEFEVKIGG